MEPVKPIDLEIENKAETEEVKHVDPEQENKDETGASIYLSALPNRIVVARNRPLSYYVDRSRRILRMEEELYVCGRASC